MALVQCPCLRRLTAVLCLLVCVFIPSQVVWGTQDPVLDLTPSSVDLTKSVVMDESSFDDLLPSDPSNSSSIGVTEVPPEMPSNNTAVVQPETTELKQLPTAPLESSTAVAMDNSSSSSPEEDKLNPSMNSSHLLPPLNISSNATVSPVTPSNNISVPETFPEVFKDESLLTESAEGVPETAATQSSDMLLLQQNNATQVFDLIETDTNKSKEAEVLAANLPPTNLTLANQAAHVEEIEQETRDNHTVAVDNSAAKLPEVNLANISVTAKETNETWMEEPSPSVVIGVISSNESIVETNSSSVASATSNPEVTLRENTTNDSNTETKLESTSTLSVSIIPVTSETAAITESATPETSETTTTLPQTEILLTNTASTDATPLTTAASALFPSWFVLHFNCNCTVETTISMGFVAKLRDKLVSKAEIPSKEFLLTAVNCSNHNFVVNMTVSSDYESKVTEYMKSLEGFKDPYLEVNGHNFYLQYVTGGPGEFHPHPQVILSERHTDIEFVIYVALGSACAFLLTLAVVLVICKYCQGKPYKGFDLNDTSHLSLRLEDYTLTRIPRAKSIYIDYCRPAASEHYSPLDEQSVNSSGLVRSFDTSIVPLEDAPTDLTEGAATADRKPAPNTKEMYSFANEAKISPHHDYEEIDVNSVKSTENLNSQSAEKKAQWGVDNATFTT